MPDIILTALAVSDAEALLQFEVTNRAWFEGWIGPRPDTYWDLESLREILRAQAVDADKMYLIRNYNNAILGRINLTAALDGVAHLGYRIGQAHICKGVATAAIGHIREHAKEAGLWAIEARVADSNPASVKALKNNGFIPIPAKAQQTKVVLQGKEITLRTFRLLLD